MRHTAINTDTARLVRASVITVILYTATLLFVAALEIVSWQGRSCQAAAESTNQCYASIKISLNPQHEDDTKLPRAQQSQAAQKTAIPTQAQSTNSDAVAQSDGYPAHELTPASGSKDAFTLWLDQAIKTRLVYPYSARKRKIEGAVMLTLTPAPDGSSCTAKILRSSGFSVLDSAALELIASLFPAPVPPKEIRTQTITIEYRLEEKKTGNHNGSRP
ncbi:MAG: energy transducer TonB [Spirochaetales bacterium]|nr:energy transducer TonB [Spirochaetales bacterium]